MKYPLATDSWDDDEVQAVIRTLESGQLTMGSRVREFEEHFAKFVGVPHAVMVNSGSSANLIMVAALHHLPGGGLSPGDEILVPAVSWATTFYPVTQCGFRLRFVDIDRDTLNLDPAKVEEAITPNTRALLSVNLLGNPNPFPGLQTICNQHDLVLLEDNCEALGAELDGRQAGSFGLMSTFSFYFSHHMSTMEGGMVLTSDAELAQVLRSLRSHGWTRGISLPPALTNGPSDDPFESLFKFALPGYNVRPIEMEAAVGLEQLRKLPAFIEQRRVNARHFESIFDDHPVFSIQQEIGKSSWFGFSLLLRDPQSGSRPQLASYLVDHGVEVRPIVAGNFVRQPVMRHLEHSVAGDLANADYVDDHGLFVGNSEKPLNAEIEYLGEILDKWC